MKHQASHIGVGTAERKGRGTDSFPAGPEAFLPLSLADRTSRTVGNPSPRLRPTPRSWCEAVVDKICFKGSLPPLSTLKDLSVRPSLHELQADWYKAQAARKKYLTP